MRQFTPLFAAVALVLATPALAQTSNPPANANNAPVLTQPPADSMTVTAYYKQNVYDPNNNKIGQIVDVLVAKDGKITAFVVGAGGFLGMGKHDVMVPFSAVKVVREEDRAAANDRNANNNNNNNTRNDRRAARNERLGSNNYRLVMDVTKDALKNAPGVKYDRTAMTWVPDDSNRNAAGRNDANDQRTTGRRAR